MNELGLFQLFVLPAGLGLFGFIEPCSIGSSLLLVKYLEDKGAAEKIRQTALFAATRAVFIGLLGIAAVVVGSGFVAFQKTAWIVLGVLYALLGILLLAGRAGALMVAAGPGIARLSGLRGSAGLGCWDSSSPARSARACSSSSIWRTRPRRRRSAKPRSSPQRARC